MRRPHFSTIALALLVTLGAATNPSGQAQSRIVFQGGTGGNNFEIIWRWLTERLRQDPTLNRTIEIVPSDGIAGLDALEAGTADFTMVKAPATVGLASRGLGLFGRPYRNLRAFGVLPVPDWLTLIVRPGIRAATVAELLQHDRPLRIATGRDSPRDVVTLLFEEILRSHGSSLEDLKRRNWTVSRLEPGGSLRAALEGSVDVVFQEAQSMPSWDDLFDKGWTVVAIDAPALAQVEQRYGFGRTTIPPEWHRSTQRIETVEFSDVVLCVRANVPEATVSWVTRTFLQRMPEIEDVFRKRTGRRPWLAYPVEPAFFKAATVIPHHPGASRAFGEAGAGKR